jgi:hypothetical protein
MWWREPVDLGFETKVSLIRPEMTDVLRLVQQPHVASSLGPPKLAEPNADLGADSQSLMADLTELLRITIHSNGVQMRMGGFEWLACRMANSERQEKWSLPALAANKCPTTLEQQNLALSICC